MSHPLDNVPSLPHVCFMDYEVIIAGGGLNGLTLALALDQVGICTAVIDRQTTASMKLSSFDGRSYALSAASKKMLSVLDVWPSLARNAEPMLEIKVTDGRAGAAPSPFMMEFRQEDMPEGPMGYVVEDRHLRLALFDAIKRSSVTHLPSENIISHDIEFAQVSVTLGDKSCLQAPLLVGADGRASQIAKDAGITRAGWAYEQSSLVCAIQHEKPHNNIAHQYFMSAGPLAILPLSGNRSGIVWTEKTETAQAINALDDAAYLEILQPRFGNFLGKISLAGNRYTYPLSLSTTYSMISQRLALVGDAAHAVHPIAGQGLNAGFKDVAALAEVLCNARRRGQDLGVQTALEEYQRWRRFDNAILSLATNGFNRLFSNDNPISRGLRDLGMGLINNSHSIRRAFVANAAGTAGEVPKLMQGSRL